MSKKDIRRDFRRAVFDRGADSCQVCGSHGHDRQLLPMHNPDDIVPLDAHHITPREDMPNGGYVVENGISLCESCHCDAESGFSSENGDLCRENLYELIGSSHETAIEASRRLV